MFSLSQLRHGLLSLFPGQAPVALPPVIQVNSAKIDDWIRKFDGEVNRLKMIERNGLYSLLEKKVLPILEEGKAIVDSGVATVASQVESDVKPRLELLKGIQTLLNEKQSIKEEDQKIEKKWEKLGVPMQILEEHADFARFMVESGLLFKVVGYRESTNSEMHDIKLDHDRHPMIKVEGEFKRWELIKQQLKYDSKEDRIVSSSYAGTIAQGWSYLSPHGLVSMDKLNHDRIVPIFQLTPDEHRKVKENAAAFYTNNTQVDSGVVKDWVIQFHTSPRRQFVSSIPPLPENPLLDNLVRNLNTHIVMRLIAPDGNVYSVGLEMPMDSQMFLWENGLAKFLGTVSAKVNKTGDYEEFRPFTERLVTSIPLTSQRAGNIIDYLNTLGDVRFNFLRQNCSNLMGIVAKKAGYEIPMLTTVQETLVDMLPDIKHVPVIGLVAHPINQAARRALLFISSMTPKALANLVAIPLDIALFVPRKITLFAINSFIKRYGGAEMLHSLPSDVEDEELYNAGRFLNFSRLIKSWSDLWSEKTQELYHSKSFIDWQRQQSSTVVHRGTDRPRLAIAPPAA